MIIVSVFAMSLILCSVCGGKSDLQGGNTALIYAASSGHADCVRLLIDAGANKDAKTNVRDSQCFAGASPNSVSS
jgi:hypothetical protein